MSILCTEEDSVAFTTFMALGAWRFDEKLGDYSQVQMKL